MRKLKKKIMVRARVWVRAIRAIMVRVRVIRAIRAIKVNPNPNSPNSSNPNPSPNHNFSCGGLTEKHRKSYLSGRIFSFFL